MNNKNIIWAITINVLITISEIAIGIFAGSLALISDALHNFSDVGSMSLSLWGEKVKVQKPTPLKTYGYKRAEIVIALFNSLALLAVVVFVFAEAVKRLLHPAEISAGIMFVVALVALVGNGIATRLLEKGSHDNLNLKSAWLHSMQDALFSLGVVVGAVAIHYTHWLIIDPLISIFLSLYLFKEVYALISQTVSILMESVPEDIDYAEVKKSLVGFEGVKSVEDLHIWQTDSNSRFLSAHLIVGDIDSKARHDLLCKISATLDKNFRIHHMTIQMVSEKEKKNLTCDHCN